MASLSMLRPVLFFVAAMATQACAQQAATAPDDLSPTFEHLIERKTQLPLVLQDASGDRVKVTLDATSQGNGTLQAANLLLRVFDTHLDDLLYDGGALQVRLARLDSSDRLALLVFGHVLHFRPGNDNPDKPDSSEDVLFIYTVQCPVGRFVQAYRSASFDIALQTKLQGRQPCS